MRALADGLTLARALAALPLLLCLTQGRWALAWWLLLLGAATDALDGWLARRAGGGTAWGARLDPLADKLLVSAPLLWLLQAQRLPVLLVWLLLSRELLVSAWRSTSATGAPAALAGKVKTALQLIALLLLLWPPAWGPAALVALLQAAGWWLLWPMLALSLLSAWQYLRPPAAPLN
ncbi:CDP-diacylglycerol--glycerol-3-phosphate 3-phosphatidyltransferase [Synechococcus sp. RSCCF101]|uniref:CDP-alcohol phosphatidyltransferase family protein n=1 Tax=Synechococcus sp. RSCCF101 TaxID=2511069 RepID=UPI0012450F67|nr:CDP-alcohol phosphatidyltransferase family protein [Synechococcus sp. RSCCF101]QEY31660.1 CDP-diacylglycerol--glycerol-3-phosphate 3-phosphatidyltransferase [Synechococcus sp. RSCCF101]